MKVETRCYCAIIETSNKNKIKSKKLTEMPYKNNSNDVYSEVSYVFGLRQTNSPWNQKVKEFMSTDATPFGGVKAPNESVRRTLSRRTFIESLGQCVIPNKKSVKMKLWFTTFDANNAIKYKFYLVSSESLLSTTKKLDKSLVLVNSGLVRIKHKDISKYIAQTNDRDFNTSKTKKFYLAIASRSAAETIEFLNVK